jgi:hypothetical protein
MYVCWWHVGRLIKVEFADDPIGCVNRYWWDHELVGEDLRVFELDAGTDAEWAARQLRRMLEANGFRRIQLPLRDAVDDFHLLDGLTFDDAHQLLQREAHHIVGGRSGGPLSGVGRRSTLCANRLPTARIGRHFGSTAQVGAVAMTKIEVVIYEDDKPIGKWVGFANRPQAVRAVVTATPNDKRAA